MMTLWQGLCHLPTSWHPVMGKLFGKLLFLFAGSRKKIAQVNLALCFPNLPKTEQQKLLRDNSNINIYKRIIIFKLMRMLIN